MLPSLESFIGASKEAAMKPWMVQWNLSNTDTSGPIKCVLSREVSSFQGANNTYLQHEVGTWSSVLIREVSSFQGANNTYLQHEVGTWSSFLIREVFLVHGCPQRRVPLYSQPLLCWCSHYTLAWLLLTRSMLVCTYVGSVPAKIILLSQWYRPVLVCFYVCFNDVIGLKRGFSYTLVIPLPTWYMDVAWNCIVKNTEPTLTLSLPVLVVAHSCLGACALVQFPVGHC